MLSTEGFKALFGPGSAYTYLNRTLRKQGELLDNYYGVAGSPLANEIALISGQGPTRQTVQDCPQYTALSPATVGARTKQVQGDGCVYPAATASLPDQLVANGQTWKGYIEGMDTIAPPSAPATTTSSSATTTSAPVPPGATTSAAHERRHHDDVGVGADDDRVRRAGSHPGQQPDSLSPPRHRRL